MPLSKAAFSISSSHSKNSQIEQMPHPTRAIFGKGIARCTRSGPFACRLAYLPSMQHPQGDLSLILAMPGLSPSYATGHSRMVRSRRRTRPCFPHGAPPARQTPSVERSPNTIITIHFQTLRILVRHRTIFNRRSALLLGLRDAKRASEDRLLSQSDMPL